MILKRSLLIFAIGIISTVMFSQVEERLPSEGRNKDKEDFAFSRRLVFGAEFGLSFGSITYIKLAPLVGYRITNRLTAGLGPIYIYEKYRAYRLETSTYGGRLAASYTILKAENLPRALSIGDIALHVENEVINVATFDSYYYQFTERLWIDNILMGAGITQAIGERFAVSIYILWDVSQNIYSPYNNPVLKFGFTF